MEIKSVSIIGLGALGILFGSLLAPKMLPGDLRFIADQERIDRYINQNIYCNGEECSFKYVTPQEKCEPADLVIFTVKERDLKDAIPAAVNQIGEKTIILSALNGISSEAIIGRTYSMEKILYCVAQGMDAVKVGNKLTYEHTGMLCIGDREPGIISASVKRMADFFDKVGFPYEVHTDMYRRLWGKLMLNVGVNQTVALYETNYGGVQQAGPARDTMISAMREVMSLSEKEGIHLNEEDLNYWLQVLSTLNPEGKPSMRQDMEAGRYSEVELFAGTILKLGKKHGVPTPVNKMLYEQIKFAEGQF
ncbi:MAG: ketopantoate reductase family protein [Syntrophomonas sp.]|nr:ketopantoate reductase family protein [Syntrophomonas sp.]